MEYRLDLHDVHSIEDFHDKIGEVFPLPEYYGRNLDALHDILTEFASPADILVDGLEEASQRIPEYLEKFKKLCKYVQIENKDVHIYVRLLG